MSAQACEPCAKRKVRCDKGDPCQNCKRRKIDQCVYPETSPFERIKKLEALVKSLGGDPESDPGRPPMMNRPMAKSSAHGLYQQHRQPQEKSGRSPEGRSRDPVIVEEDGQSFYLESRAWHGWNGHASNHDMSHEIALKNPFTTRNHPNAFQSVLSGHSSIDLAARSPSQDHATTLWEIFNQRVRPIIRISFGWDLKRLRSACIDPQPPKQLSDAEQTFVFSLYLISVVSLSDDECRKMLSQPKAVLLSDFQLLCEEALTRTNIFCITDIMDIKALTVYIMAGMERLSTLSLSSLMGMVLRNAEKLGIHRDGTLLGLSPIQTEERRRVWWQLQHLDLALAVRSGSTPLIMGADWDAKLPLNIEDEDIDEGMVEAPNERKGLTSMSYCLFTYWVLDQQRHFFHAEKGRFALSWQSNESLPDSSKESLIEQLENGINKNFLQYCDPIKPMDILLQLLARALICGMRMRTLLSLAQSEKSGLINEEHRNTLLTASVQLLEYNIAMHSHPSLRNFQWLVTGFFPWQAFMCILVEMSQGNDISKRQRFWDLLSDLYTANASLSELLEDRRKLHAARLVVAAWKARPNKSETDRSVPSPDLVANLEARLSEGSTGLAPNTKAEEAEPKSAEEGLEPVTSESLMAEQDFSAVFDLDFQDIDWSFWNSID